MEINDLISSDCSLSGFHLPQPITSMSNIPVVILQTSGSAFFEASEGLQRAGLRNLEDYVLHDKTGIVFDNDIASDKEQLFITGTIQGSEAAAIELVKKLKAKNPKLIVASFSVKPMAGPFDINITKEGMNYPHLIETIKSFLAGNLKKTLA
jgi:hypothetical protein